MDIEKTMQFLLEQQARFDARQAQFEERYAQLVEQQAQTAQHHAELVQHQGQFEKRMSRIENVLLDLANAQANTNAILGTLAERHVSLAQSHQELSEAQKVTEQNLNALIATVERHIANHK